MQKIFLKLLQSVWFLTGKSQRMDEFLTRKFLKFRKHYLTKKKPNEIISGYDDITVKLEFSHYLKLNTPLSDLWELIKFIKAFQPKSILELGSYNGHSALVIAQNTPPETKIVAMDIWSEHGGAYKNTPYEVRIERRVGKINSAIFEKEEMFDFIFVDASHRYEDCRNDTEIALGHLNSGGVVVWHDSDNNRYFDGKLRVPEALKDINPQMNFEIVRVIGTTLAFYRKK